MDRDLPIRALETIFESGCSIAEGIDSVVDESPRKGVQDLVSGTIRWKVALETWILTFCRGPAPKGRLKTALLLAAYQISQQTRVGPQLVVNETVEWVKKRCNPKQAGFANAVLRKLVADKESLKLQKLIDGSSRFSLPGLNWAGFPGWAIEDLKTQYDEAWIKDMIAHGLDRPVIWGRIHAGQAPAGSQAGPVPESYRLNSLGELNSSTYVQDISSQILISEVSQILSEMTGKNPSELRVLDRCAAPGGKSIGMAWNGYTITAVDKTTARLELMQTNLDRLGLRSSVGLQLEEDFLNSNPGPFDLVWVDAPCTSLGLVRRHPEVKLQKTEEDWQNVRELQAELVHQSARWIGSGGFLMVSVCSPLPSEMQSIQDLERFEIVKQWTLGPHLDPGRGDGFQAALLKRH